MFKGFQKYRKSGLMQPQGKFANRKTYLVSISTPYLTETIKTLEEAYESIGKDPRQGVITQIKHGFHPNNLHGKDHLMTRKGNIVLLSTHNNSKIACPVVADMDISGCTEDVEIGVKELMGSGLIVARYSIFYGKNSGYTGNSPENSGYSLDIPKNPQTVKALLKNDSFLEALVSRDGSKILRSLGRLNRKLERPILVTPYLEEVLEARK